MKTRLFLTFAAILAVTAVAGGCRDAPMAPVPEEAGLGAPALRNVSPDPLTVSMQCSFWDFDEIICHATASGGTGTGYTFNWFYNTRNHLTIGDYSQAYYTCYHYGTQSVYVQVSDSGGGSAWVVSDPNQCAYGYPYESWTTSYPYRGEYEWYE